MILEMRWFQVLSFPKNPLHQGQTHPQAEETIILNKMIDDPQDRQEVGEIGDSQEIEIEEVGVDHQEDHLGKILGLMQRG